MDQEEEWETAAEDLVTVGATGLDATRVIEDDVIDLSPETRPPPLAGVEVITDEVEVSVEDFPEDTTEDATEGLSRIPRLFPIQVVLNPPSNPDEYMRLPPSQVVEKLLEEVELDDGTWYSVEFEDGRIEQVAYDELLEMENGKSSHDRFRRDQNFGLEQASMSRQSSKHPRAEEDYSDLDSRESDVPRKRHSTRRVTRQKTKPRHTFADNVADLGLDRHSRNIDRDDDEDGPNGNDSHNSRLGPNKRSLRSRQYAKPVVKNYSQLFSSDDELQQQPDSDDDGDNFMPVVSDLAPARSKRSSARKKTKAAAKYSLRPQRSQNDEESDIEFETINRRSGRSNMTTKNMKIPDVDDDYDVVEDNASSAPKHVSVKEIFQALPVDSEFEKFHSATCETCQTAAGAGRGPLICCQGCSYSYHKACLGTRSARDHRVTKIGSDSFVLQCRICIGTYQKKDPNAPNHAMCQTCKLDGLSCAEFSTRKTPKQEEKLRLDNDGEDPVTDVDPHLINNVANILFRCTACKRGFHFEHLPPLTKDFVVPDDLRAKRLDEYAMVDFRCKECVDAPQKIHALVAWRPTEIKTYVVGDTCLDVSEDRKQYLVKWDGRSHFHDTWMPGAWVFGAAAGAMRSAFNRRETSTLPKMDTKAAIDEEWLLADVILEVKFRSNAVKLKEKRDVMTRIGDVREVRVKFQGLSYEEVVWDSPPPRDSGAPWDAFCEAFEEYADGLFFPHVSDVKMKERIKQYRALHFPTECEAKVQPPGLKRGKLMEYQMEGLNWLLYNFHGRHNIILADEMGLGKTVQVVALVSSLVHDKPNCWPFLIVVPNSTCPNWRRELKQWAPDLRVVTYHGGKVAQALARDYELFPDPSRGMKAHVVIMSYEAAVEAKNTFKSVNWAGLVVDEGQRLKNDRSLLYLALQDLNIPFRLLLTGTPLQNNKRELFNLLQFVEPVINAEELDLKYAELNKENLPELHDLIRPYFLRRTKAQVLKFLPPMAQIILPVTMTLLQEKLCKSIIARNPDLIKAIVSKDKIKAGERKSLNNILMELRRCLCHPFMFNGNVEDRSITDPVKIQQNLVEASGKLLLLKFMLPKLKERGHRVLIFSQFLLSLTIIEDFLTYIGLSHARIDGSISALEKQKRIDAFNAPDSPLFAMLLSTRAGGVGINLATADTVIIYDPDFNPHQDIQALSRAHRIGQKDKVLCFQLMTKDTVEEKIMQIGRKKMALDHALIEAMDAEDDAGDDLESILKHGAESLFTDNARAKITYDSTSVDKLIDRTQMENTSVGDDQSAESQFSFARVWANDEGTLNTNVVGETSDDAPADSSVWENILRQREEEHKRELAAKQQEYGRGARRRAKEVQYNRVGFNMEDLDDDFLTWLQPPQEHHSDHSENDYEDELYVDGMEVEDDNQDEADEDFEADGPASSKATGTRATEAGVPKRPRNQVPEAEAILTRKHRTSSSQSRLKQAPPLSHPPPIPRQVIPQSNPRLQGPPVDPQGQTNRLNTNFIVPTQGLQHLQSAQWDYTVTPPPPHISQAQPQLTIRPNLQTTPQAALHPPNGSRQNLPSAGSRLIRCYICQQPHPIVQPMACVDLNNEISLRLALDNLRTSQGHPGVLQSTRYNLTQRLRELTQLDTQNYRK